MLTTLLAVLVLGFAAAVQMASGFGFALMAVPMLAVVVGAHDAVLLAVLEGAVFCAYQAIEGRGHRDGWVVARLLAGAAAGLPVGYLVFRRIDADLLTLLIGVLVLVATAALARGLTFSSRSPAADLVAGACAGVLTTSTATNGPPVVLLLSGRRLPLPARGRLLVPAGAARRRVRRLARPRPAQPGTLPDAGARAARPRRRRGRARRAHLTRAGAGR